MAASSSTVTLNTLHQYAHGKTMCPILFCDGTMPVWHTGMFFTLQANFVKIYSKHTASVLVLDMRTGTCCFQKSTACT